LRKPSFGETFSLLANTPKKSDELDNPIVVFGKELANWLSLSPQIFPVLLFTMNGILGLFGNEQIRLPELDTSSIR
jgi:hypothetical protein